MPSQQYGKDKLESYSIHDLEQSKKVKDVVRSSGDLQYASLHHHTTFSYLDGFGLPKDHVMRAAELGMPAMAITEHGNMSSHPQFERAARAAGIKPIFGCEMYCGEIDEERRTQRKNHLTLLAETQTGYRNLLALVERSYAEGFYYEATIDGHMLAEHKEGIVVMSGCLGSLLATSVVGGKNVDPEDASLARGMRVARRFQRVFGDAYYLEVQPFPELEKTCVVNQAMEQISQRYGIPLVVTGDVHYMTPKESEMQAILHNVRGGAKETLEQQEAAWGHDVHLSIPDGRVYLYKRLRATGMSKRAAREAVENTMVIADRCNAELPKSGKLRFPAPEGMDSVELWRQHMKEGWKFRGFNKLPRDKRNEYMRRLKYEMRLIEDKDFVDYFLIVGDAVRWAKDHGITVGPARGSAAGSLACYLLRITEVNPMLFPNLIFERFVDATREDEPDIDLDFDDTRREEVREYLVQKYGTEHVANLATFTYYKSKNSLDDLARVYRVPQWEVDKIKGLLVERSSGDLRASATIEDTAEMFSEVKDVFDKYPDLRKAMRLEGNIKAMGVHPAGVVVSNQDTPIRELVPVHRRMVNEKPVEVAAMDKYDAELMGLLKMDFLGLKTMGLFGLALKWLGWKLQDLYDIPLDDEETAQGFRENDVVAVFQFDGQATKDIASTIRPDTFAEVYHTNAMSRPGPLHNGATANYINVKNGIDTAEKFKMHPIYDDITKDTMFQLVYQEQILRIVTEIGGFDWTHVAYIRRLISRKMGEQEFNRERARFMKGAKKNNVDKDTANRIWKACITAGSYAFNAAHAVSYGMNAWYTMYLKRHYPEVFFAAALAKYEDKQRKILRDALTPPKGVSRKPIVILPPHPRLSDVNWKPTKKGVRAGFVQIPGIGDKMAPTIIADRKRFQRWNTEDGGRRKYAWKDMLAIKGIGPKTVDKMVTFAHDDDPFGVYKLRRELDVVRNELRTGKLGDGIPPTTHTAEQIPYEAGQELDVVWAGVILKRNLRDLFEYHLSKKGEELDPESVDRPELREWVVMLCEDDTEICYVTFSRYDYPKFKDMIWGATVESDIILVQGRKRKFLNKRDILVNNMWVIEP